MIKLILTDQELKNVFNQRIMKMQDWMKDEKNLVDWYTRDYVVDDASEHVKFMATDLKFGLKYLIEIIDKMFIREGSNGIFLKEDTTVDGYDALMKLFYETDDLLINEGYDDVIMISSYYINNLMQILKSNAID